MRIMCVVPDSLNDMIVMRAWEESKTNQEVVRDAIRDYMEEWEPDKETLEEFEEEESDDEEESDEEEEEDK